jgi:hypothetical protein
VVIAAVIYLRSRASKVDHRNVNAEWTGAVSPSTGSVATGAGTQAGTQAGV